MKTLFAILAGASILAAPLAASAQDHHDAAGGRGQWNGGGRANAAPAPQGQVQRAPSQGGRGSVSGQPGGFDRRGGGYGQQGQPRSFNGAAPNREVAGRGFDNRGFDNNRNPDNRGQVGRGFDRRDGDRSGYGRRGFAGGDYRQGYGDRGHDRGYGRSFRWGVGAFLPQTYWRYSVDPYAYGLNAAPYGYHWVLVEGAALLIDDYTGAIVQETWI